MTSCAVACLSWMSGRSDNTTVIAFHIFHSIDFAIFAIFCLPERASTIVISDDYLLPRAQNDQLSVIFIIILTKVRFNLYKHVDLFHDVCTY